MKTKPYIPSKNGDEEKIGVLWKYRVFNACGFSIVLLFCKEVIKMTKQKIERQDFLVWICVFFITMISILPYLTSKIYSIDDYHLLNIYNLNWETLGYNFYSTGRPIEGLLAEILYRFNLQPLNKPMGAVAFVAAISFSGVYMAKYLNINEFKYKIIFVALVTSNPFFVELYYYGTVTIYCAFAVLMLAVGLFFSNQFILYKKWYYLVLSCICYICSLGTYQIFYPIIGFCIMIKGIMNLRKRSKDEWKNIGIIFCIYLLSFIWFYIILRIAFSIKAPALIYDGIDVLQFIRELFTLDYWKIMVGKMVVFLLKNNPFFSSLSLKILLLISLLIFVQSLKKAEKRYMEVLFSVIFICIGLYLVFGMGITRPNSISARTLTAFGIYEAGLFVLFLQFGYKEKKWLLALFGWIVFVNSAMAGKNALNTMRLNEIEMNMANRIVARMETFEEFSANATLVILGVPATGSIGSTGIGDYNVPASVSFSKVLMFNEATGYTFTSPTSEQYEIAYSYIEEMNTWPKDKSVLYKDGMFIVRLYY